MDQNILIKRGIKSIQHLSKIDVIIVSVNYNDFLPITLENNIKIFDSITVVTSINDEECQKICQKFNVNCVVTERMYDNGAIFNKGKAINEGIKSLLNPNWILLLDADIIVPETFTESFKNNYTNINSLYVCNRIMFREYQSYLDWKFGSGAKGQVSNLNGIGYFQLFNINSKCLQRIIYPETSNNAAGSDISFRNRFTEKVDLKIESIHLGIPYQNWNGRKTPDFITTSENTQSIQKVNSKKKYKICSYYFNLKNDPRLKNNFLRFIKQFEGRYENLIVGLVNYGDIDFELPCETIIIKGDVDNKVWSKEIIINKVIDTIDDVDYLMWIDGDLIYDDLSWLDNIDDVVKDKDFVQLFENVNYLNENEQISNSYKSICFKLKNDLKPMNSSKISKYESKSDFKPGLSWLGRFSILKEKKIFEKMYTSDGDVIFLYGINGVNEGLTLNRIKESNLEIYNEAVDWINSFGRYSLGYLNQTINHLYHGEISDRDYIKRGRYKELSKLKEVTKIKYKEFDLNTYFDKIYCLNLKKRENRWIYSNYQFINNNISVERFDAIDGKLIDFNSNNNINLELLSRKGIIENKGALGCLKSHLEIIKDAKSKNYKRILIFEDDILLSDNFNEEVKRIKDIDWNLLYLGASQFEWSNIKSENGLYKCSKTLGTFAYALDISIYDEVLKMEEYSEKSIDNILSDVQSSNDKCYTLFPNIVISDVSESDIRSSKSIVEYSKKVKWDLDKFGNISYLERIKSTTIIIPCYGHSKYLEECIDSCLSQSIRPSGILVLLMDEDSISLKNKIEDKSNIIKCIISEKMKLSEARNFCVDKIETEYFIPLDADDKIPENFIEEICKIESDVVYIGSEYFGSQSGVWPNPITEEINWTKLTTFRRNSLVCTALIKKESFIKSGKYNESLWAFEDMDLWVRMYKNDFIFKKCFNTKLLYRKHSLSDSLLSQANSNEKNRKELNKIIMCDDFYKRTPKIIHWVWIGNNPIPEKIVKTWKKNLPEGEWEYMLWNEDNFDMNSCEFLKKSYESKKYGICVDYIRAKVLYEYGGVWLDADCLITNDISPFLQYDFFGSWENINYLNIGLIGCSPKMYIIKEILDYYTNINIDDSVIKSHHRFVNEIGTGPMVLTKELMKIKNIRNGGFTNDFIFNNKKYLIETPEIFVLDDSNSGKINYAIHLFDGSWTDKKEEWSVVVRRSYDNWKNENKI